MLMTALATSFLALAQAPNTAPQEPSGKQPDLPALIEEAKKGDLATAINESIDSTEIDLSPRMFRAIQAVERYRMQSQRKQLTAEEAVLDNFNITVKPGSASKWLPEPERKLCYLVVLTPRFRPGEKVATDRHGKVGRVSLYAVRKANYDVVRSHLGEL
jgi:hypothetical protein